MVSCPLLGHRVEHSGKPGLLPRFSRPALGNRRSQVGAANRARSPIDWYHLKSHRFSPVTPSRHVFWRLAFPPELYVIEGGGWRHKRQRSRPRRLRRDCRQDYPRPDIHIPGSHPGHQTKNHPARKGGSISSRLFSRKTKAGNPPISQISQMGNEESQSQTTGEFAEDEGGVGWLVGW